MTACFRGLISLSSSMSSLYKERNNSNGDIEGLGSIGRGLDDYKRELSTFISQHNYNNPGKSCASPCILDVDYANRGTEHAILIIQDIRKVRAVNANTLPVSYSFKTGQGIREEMYSPTKASKKTVVARPE